MPHDRSDGNEEKLDARFVPRVAADEDEGSGEKITALVFDWCGRDGGAGGGDREGVEVFENLKGVFFVLLAVALIEIFVACVAIDWVRGQLGEVWGRMDAVEQRIEAMDKILISAEGRD